jgi:hypothetical protein
MSPVLVDIFALAPRRAPAGSKNVSPTSSRILRSRCLSLLAQYWLPTIAGAIGYGLFRRRYAKS